MKKALKVPKFKNEDTERDFWVKLDLSGYLRQSDFAPVSFPNLKPSSRSISIRLPEYLLMMVKEQSNQLDIPYQSLIKRYIAQGVSEERQKDSRRPHQKVC